MKHSKEDLTHIAIILDRTGSMEEIREGYHWRIQRLSEGATSPLTTPPRLTAINQPLLDFVRFISALVKPFFPA